MTNSIIKYVKEYGNNTFMNEPMNDVDSLVLCQFSYLKFDGLVPFVSENKPSVSLQELRMNKDFDRLFIDDRYEKENRALFQAMLQSRRYTNLKVNCYVNIIENEWETQFAAMTFLLEDGTIYIAFRGTDETIIGWKEDFNMVYLSPVPAQEYSVKYLNMVAGRFYRPFYVGGHSKGGNLAVYASMNCIPVVQERILKIYNMDGPGFRPQVCEKCGYNVIADRVIKILPQSSVVGMLFESGEDYQVVESRAFGFFQHDPYTWKVVENKFVYADGIYKSRKESNTLINEWITSLSPKDLQVFVDTLYKVISAAEADNVIEFAENWKKNLKAVVAAYKEVDADTEKILKEVVSALFNQRVEKLRGKKNQPISKKKEQNDK